MEVIKMKRIAVFCASSDGKDPVYRQQAYELGKEMARRGIELVYGGANPGLMGAVADGELDNGGRVLGVITKLIARKGLLKEGLTVTEVVADLSERKKRMNEVADAFIALPGGYGTLDEFFEIAALNQMGTQFKKLGLLNVQGFYSPLEEQLELMASEELLRHPERNSIVVCDSVDELLDSLLA
jgi:TIGR00730 family protein